MNEAPGSFETSVLTRTTGHNILEDTILHSNRRENFKSYLFSVLVTRDHPTCFTTMGLTVAPQIFDSRI
jgi:hypothetical protein